MTDEGNAADWSASLEVPCKESTDPGVCRTRGGQTPDARPPVQKLKEKQLQTPSLACLRAVVQRKPVAELEFIQYLQAVLP
jgi:hypothetical protein